MSHDSHHFLERDSPPVDVGCYHQECADSKCCNSPLPCMFDAEDPPQSSKGKESYQEAPPAENDAGSLPSKSQGPFGIESGEQSYQEAPTKKPRKPKTSFSQAQVYTSSRGDTRHRSQLQLTHGIGLTDTQVKIQEQETSKPALYCLPQSLQG